MGEVALKYRIMPESPESDTENIISIMSKVIPEDANLGAHEIKPFAFGLKAIFVVILGVDREGFATEVEEALKKLPEVQSVEIEEMSLI